MKIQAIKKLCTGRKRVEIRNTTEGEQWVGDGVGFFRVDDGLRFTEENIAALFDLDEDKMAKIVVSVTHETDPRFSSDSVAHETDRYHESVMLGYLDGVAKMLREKDVHDRLADMVLIDAAYLKPVAERLEYTEYRVRPRYSSRGMPMFPLVAVYNSMFCVALIFPMNGEMTEMVLGRLRAAVQSTPIPGLDETEEEAEGVDDQMRLNDWDDLRED